MSKHLFSLIISGLFSFVFCLYAPLSTYWHGVNEFAFTAGPLFNAMLLPFFVLWAVTFIFLRLLAILLPYKPCFVFGREIRISLPDALLLACVTAIWLEGSLLSKGLPSVTGEPGLFESTPRLILDTAAWLAVFTGIFFVWKKATRAVVFLTAAMAVIIAAGLGDAYLNAEGKLPVSVMPNQVHEKLSFHPEDNIIILVSDSFPTDMAKAILQSKQDLAAGLDGFVFLENNIASSPQTFIALPSMLKGVVFDGANYRDFALSAFTAPGSLPRVFADSGKNTYFSSLLPRFCALFSDGHVIQSPIAVQLDASIFTCLLFRYIPYFLKRVSEPIVIAQIAGVSAPLVKSEATPLNKNNWFKETLTSRLDNLSDVPTAHFHHFLGVHEPYRFNADGHFLPKEEQFSLSGLQATCEWELRCFVDFLNNLRDRGMYDGTTIILTADHGDRMTRPIGKLNSRLLPLMLVKPRNSKGELTYVGAPSSNLLLPQFIQKAHRGRQVFAAYVKDLSEERRFFTNRFNVALGVDLETLIVTQPEINVKHDPTRLKVGQKYTFKSDAFDTPLAVPLNISNIGRLGGTGMDFLPPRQGTLSFVVDCKPGKKVDISFPVKFYNFPSDKYVSLTISNGISGEILYQNNEIITQDKETNFSIDVKMPNVTVGDDQTITFTIDSKNSATVILALTGIQITDSEE